jgi:DNA invertase Pin-like site-specific DNA recombinase
MARPRQIKNDILSLREQGKTYNQIVSILKCSKSTVNYHCKRYDLTDIGFKNIKIDDDTAQRIFDFCKENSISDAMKHFKVSKSTIKKYKKPPIERKVVLSV